MGETISRRRGRLYYDRGETLLRSRGDFRMGETISRDTGASYRPIIHGILGIAAFSNCAHPIVSVNDCDHSF